MSRGAGVLLLAALGALAGSSTAEAKPTTGERSGARATVDGSKGLAWIVVTGSSGAAWAVDAYEGTGLGVDPAGLFADDAEQVGRGTGTADDFDGAIAAIDAWAVDLWGNAAPDPGPGPGPAPTTGDGPATADNAPPHERGRTSVLEHLRLLESIVPDLAGTGLDIFAVVQATTESGFNSRVGLGNPALFPAWASPNLNASQRLQDGEAAAARSLYRADRNAWARASPYPDPWWEFGSGGWFGLLPTTGLSAFKSTAGRAAISSGELSPYDVFSPWRATVMMAAMVARLARNVRGNLEPEDRDWFAVKRGMAGLWLVGDVDPDDGGPLLPEEERSQRIATKFARILNDNGYASDFMYRPLPAAVAERRDWLDILREGEA